MEARVRGDCNTGQRPQGDARAKQSMCRGIWGGLPACAHPRVRHATRAGWFGVQHLSFFAGCAWELFAWVVWGGASLRTT
eukprot:5510179-Prymnesium_polylepis.1